MNKQMKKIDIYTNHYTNKGEKNEHKMCMNNLFINDYDN